MKRITLLLLGSFALTPSAFGADLPPKVTASNTATPVPVGYPAANASGFFGQIGTSAGIANSSVTTGSSTTNLFSAGGSLGGGIGYQYQIPGLGLGFTEANASYTNLGGATTCAIGNGTASCSVANPWSFDVGTAVQFNWTYPLNFIPALASIFNGTNPSSLLPAGVIPTSSVPYVGIWADINSISANINGIGGASSTQVAPEFRLGLINYLPQGGGVLKTAIGYEFSQTSFTISGPASAKIGNQLLAHLDYAF